MLFTLVVCLVLRLKILFGFVWESKTSNEKRALHCVGVLGVQPPEYTSGHRQHGRHCQAVGCGVWRGSGHSGCKLSFFFPYPVSLLLPFFWNLSSQRLINNVMINFSFSCQSNYCLNDVLLPLLTASIFTSLYMHLWSDGKCNCNS